MEFRLGKIYPFVPDNGTKVEMLDELTEAEFNQFQSALSVIQEVVALRRLRDFVVANDEELIGYLHFAAQELTDKSAVWSGVKNDDIGQVFLNTNRLLLNYLGSTRIFVDHSTIFLHRKFGETSSEFAGFKQMLSAFFDHSFAYSFFYKLRDYGVHMGLPVDGISFSIRYDKTINLNKGDLEIKFHCDKLLHAFSKWGKVKAPLELMEPKFYVTPLLFEMTQNIREIERNIELIFANELTAAAQFIANRVRHIHDAGREIFLASNIELDKNGKYKNFTQDMLPMDMVDEIIAEHV